MGVGRGAAGHRWVKLVEELARAGRLSKRGIFQLALGIDAHHTGNLVLLWIDAGLGHHVRGSGVLFELIDARLVEGLRSARLELPA